MELKNYEYIDGKKRPKFAVDTDKALELLKGAGIYEGAYQCIREILQNAVDATLLRIWMEYKDSEEFDFSTPNLLNTKRELFDDYPIKIEITEKNVEDGFKVWDFSVTDNGIGLSTHDLTYLMNTGSSSKNIKRSKLVNSMPYWLRPSGIFGIGFQSIFMLTEEVTLETKSFFNEEFQIITLNSPNSAKDGGILIKKEKTSHKRKPGTVLKFKHKTKAIPSRWMIKGEHPNATRIAHNFDPFTNESLDIEVGKIFDEIFEFSFKSYIPIDLKLNEQRFDSISDKNLFTYFDEENQFEINIYPEKTNHDQNTIYYKNQKVENGFHFRFISFDLNIHKEKANEILEINRNKIKQDCLDLIQDKALETLFRIITLNFDKIFISDFEKQKASLFLHYYKRKNSFLEKYKIDEFDQWKNYMIQIERKKGEHIIFEEVSLNYLLSTFEKVKMIFKNKERHQKAIPYFIENEELIIYLNTPSTSNHHFFINDKIESEMFFSSIEENKTNEVTEIIYNKKFEPCTINDNEIKKIFDNRIIRYYSSRMFIPCFNGFEKLRVKDDSSKYYVYEYKLCDYVNINYPKILSPYIYVNVFDNVKIELSLNEKIYDWVFENRFDVTTTKEEIIEAYNQFIEKFKP